MLKFHNPLLVGARRYYCVDADFVPSGVRGFFNWYFDTWKTVPFTMRTRRILLTIPHERKIIEKSSKLLATFEGKILPPTHPDSVRVRMIAKNIIDALQRGVKKMEYVSELTMLQRIWMGREGWLQPTTSHLDGLKWEAFVVNDPADNAYCILANCIQRIYVATGMLKHCRSDADIAIVIGHEVGHIVARHAAERLTRRLWMFDLHIIIEKYFTPDFAERVLCYRITSLHETRWKWKLITLGFY